MALTSDDLNYLIFQYLVESGYGHSAFVFGNESLANASNSLEELIPNALIDIVQKGLQYKELQARLAANGSALRAFTSSELLKAKNAHELLKISSTPANAQQSHSSRQFLTDHTGHVGCLAWHPEEAVLASGSADATGRIYHIGSEAREHRACELLPHRVPSNGIQAEVTALDWSAKGDMLATATLDGHVRIWGRNGSLHMCSADMPPLFGARFSPKGDYLVSHAADGGEVSLWRVDTGTLAASFHRHNGAVLGICWLSDCTFVTCGQDGAIHVNRIQYLQDHSPVGGNRKSRDDPDEHMENRDPPCTVAWQQNIQAHEGHVNDVVVSANGIWLATCSEDGTVRSWKVQPGDGNGGVDVNAEDVFTLQDPACHPSELAHRAAVHCAQFRPLQFSKRREHTRLELGGQAEMDTSCASHLATCSSPSKGAHNNKSRNMGAEVSIKIWDCETCRLLQTLLPPESIKHLYGVRWAPDGRHVTCATFAPRICVWCVRTSELVLQLDMRADVSAVDWSRDGCWLAVGMAGGVIELIQFEQ